MSIDRHQFHRDSWRFEMLVRDDELTILSTIVHMIVDDHLVVETVSSVVPMEHRDMARNRAYKRF